MGRFIRPVQKSTILRHLSVCELPFPIMVSVWSWNFSFSRIHSMGYPKFPDSFSRTLRRRHWLSLFLGLRKRYRIVMELYCTIMTTRGSYHLQHRQRVRRPKRHILEGIHESSFLFFAPSGNSRNFSQAASKTTVVYNLRIPRRATNEWFSLRMSTTASISTSFSKWCSECERPSCLVHFFGNSAQLHFLPHLIHELKAEIINAQGNAQYTAHEDSTAWISLETTNTSKSSAA